MTEKTGVGVMYITDPDRPAKKPVVQSQLAALREVERWMAEQGYGELKDAAGVPWQLNLTSREVPDEENPERLRWFLRLDLQTTLTGPLLVKTGTLAREADDRLLAFLGKAFVTVRMRPVEFEAGTPEMARQELLERIPKLRAQIRENHLHEVKRGLIGRWIDRRGCFGCEID